MTLNLYSPAVLDDHELTSRLIWEARILVPVSAAIDPLFGDPDDTNFTPGGGFTTPVGQPTGWMVKKDRVMLGGIVTASAGTVGAVLTTFPVGIRPGFTHYYNSYSGTTDTALWRLGSNGQLTLSAVSGTLGNLSLDGIDWQIGN